MTDATADLALAHELADLADAISLAAFRGPLEIRRKPDGTPVTEVDLAVERAIRDHLRHARPDHAVLGEEDGRDGPDGAPTWIVDPIDGTRSFMTGNPVWATLIACEIDGGGHVGVVSAPAMGARWDGVAGGVARRNGQEIRVSDVADLRDAQVSFGDLQSFDELGRPDILTDLVDRTVRQRAYGDFWSFCLVAEGIVDLAVEGLASRWDLAAPRVLVEAAGGRFTALDGTDTSAGGGGVATNGLLHDAVLAVTRP